MQLKIGLHCFVGSLQVTIAKVQQSLPELKRDGSNVLASLWSDLVLYSQDSTSRAGGILPQLEFVPKLAKQLQESPSEVIADLEAIRKCCQCSIPTFFCMLTKSPVMDPSGIRFSVTGNVLRLEKPRSIWAKYFAPNLPVLGSFPLIF